MNGTPAALCFGRKSIKTSSGCPPAIAVHLPTAFLKEALLDRRDVRLAVAKRILQGVDRVVAEDEIVLVRNGRALTRLGDPLHSRFRGSGGSGALAVLVPGRELLQNQIPLDKGVAPATAALSNMAKAWKKAKIQIFAGKTTKPDSEDLDTVNHLTWYEATNFKRPYPGETKVRPPTDFQNLLATRDEDPDDL
jgi:hypothetical protein